MAPMRAMSSFVYRWSLLLSTILVIHAVLAVSVEGQEAGGKTQVGSDVLISYQGRLTDGAGNPVADTDHTIVFKLYDQESGGSPIWQETQNIPTSNGVFSAQLGAVNSLDGLAFDQQYYLGIEVDGGDELSPRTQLTETPYAVRAYSVSDGAVTSDAISDGAVTSSELGDRSVTSDKLDYGAVDSAAIDPSAVTKTLRPTLELNTGDQFVGVNRSDAVTSNEFFGVRAPVSDDIFGGMYIDTEGAEAWPFYGYASSGDAHAWHLFDPGTNEWILEFDFTSPRFRLVANEDGIVPGGDGDLTLGSSSHRWSEVYATNGTIQTSDRRLKTGIDALSYGLEEVLRLDPVSYRWKEASSDDTTRGERHLGLVAQEVQKVVGEVVEEPASSDGYLGMNYAELVPVLVRAIQEQQEIIERQKRKLASQEEDMQAQVNALKQQVRQLARQIEQNDSDESRQATAVASD